MANTEGVVTPIPNIAISAGKHAIHFATLNVCRLLLALSGGFSAGIKESLQWRHVAEILPLVRQSQLL